MNLTYRVLENSRGPGYLAAVMRDGVVWGQRGPYRTHAEAMRAIELMSGDTGARIGDSPDGARTLLQAK